MQGPIASNQNTCSLAHCTLVPVCPQPLFFTPHSCEHLQTPHHKNLPGDFQSYCWSQSGPIIDLLEGGQFCPKWPSHLHAHQQGTRAPTRRKLWWETVLANQIRIQTSVSKEWSHGGMLANSLNKANNPTFYIPNNSQAVPFCHSLVPDSADNWAWPQKVNLRDEVLCPMLPTPFTNTWKLMQPFKNVCQKQFANKKP